MKASKPTLEIVTANEVFAPPGVPVAVAELALAEPTQAHVHEFFELAFVTAGQAVHTSEAGTMLLHPGHVVVIAAGGWHAYDPEPELHVVSIRVGIEVLRELLPWLEGGARDQDLPVREARGAAVGCVSDEGVSRCCGLSAG